MKRLFLLAIITMLFGSLVNIFLVFNMTTISNDMIKVMNNTNGTLNLAITNQKTMINLLHNGTLTIELANQKALVQLLHNNTNEIKKHQQQQIETKN